jgi:hypothetical protein
VDSLWVRQTASPNLSLAGDIAVKADAFFIGRIFDPCELLRLHDEVAVIIRKLLEIRLDSRSTATPDFFSPSIPIDFSLQSLLAKDLTQMLRAQAYNR